MAHTDEAERQEIDIDVKGGVRGVHLLLPMLLKRDRAVITTVTSVAGYVLMAVSPIYSATKAFVHSYTESLRFSVKNTNVDVVELVPPAMDTEMRRKNLSLDIDMIGAKEYVKRRVRP